MLASRAGLAARRNPHAISPASIMCIRGRVILCASGLPKSVTSFCLEDTLFFVISLLYLTAFRRKYILLQLDHHVLLHTPYWRRLDEHHRMGSVRS
jgi:hypothetical protein